MTMTTNDAGSEALRQLYQTLILDHARDPHGYGLPDDEPAGGAGEARETAAHPWCESHQVNPTCGDEIRLRATVADGEDGPVLADVRWAGSGCSISQASASVMCDLVVGHTLDEVGAVARAFRAMMHSRGQDEGDEDVLEDAVAFSGVSRYPARVKCAMLGWTALADALYQSRPEALRATDLDTIRQEEHR